MARLIHIIYSSAAKSHFGSEELLALLGSARSKNSSMNISGMLLHIEGSFLQVIEGVNFHAEVSQVFHREVSHL
jgi:hypothetical protein